MSIVIKTKKKVSSDGIKGRVIKKIKALKQSELPSLYFSNKEKSVFLSEYRNRLIDSNYNSILKVDEFINESVFQDKIEYIKKCGDYLKEVKDKLKSLREEWNGKETFII